MSSDCLWDRETREEQSCYETNSPLTSKSLSSLPLTYPHLFPASIYRTPLMLHTLIWSQVFGFHTETPWPISTASTPWKGRLKNKNGPFSFHATDECLCYKPVYLLNSVIFLGSQIQLASSFSLLFEGKAETDKALLIPLSGSGVPALLIPSSPQQDSQLSHRLKLSINTSKMKL